MNSLQHELPETQKGRIAELFDFFLPLYIDTFLGSGARSRSHTMHHRLIIFVPPTHPFIRSNSIIHTSLLFLRIIRHHSCIVITLVVTAKN